MLLSFPIVLLHNELIVVYSAQLRRQQLHPTSGISVLHNLVKTQGSCTLVQCRTRCNARGLSYGGGWIQGWFWGVADVTVMDLVAIIIDSNEEM
jgi:hypothetical protein